MFHHRFAVDNDGVHVHGVACINGKGYAVKSGFPVEAASVYQDDISQISFFQFTQVVVAQAFSSVSGSHVYRFFSSNGEGIVIGCLVDEGGEAHFGEHIQLVVGGGAVGADAYGNACFSHFRNRGNAAGQFEVGSGVMGHGDMFFFHDTDIVIGHMNAVGGQGRSFEEAQGVHEGNGRHVVFIFAIFHFSLCFGKVDVNGHIVFFCHVSDFLNIVRWAGIGCMGSHHNFEAAVPCPVPVFIEFYVFVDALLAIGADARKASGQVAADAGFVGAWHRRP